MPAAFVNDPILSEFILEYYNKASHISEHYIEQSMCSPSLSESPQSLQSESCQSTSPGQDNYDLHAETDAELLSAVHFRSE